MRLKEVEKKRRLRVLGCEVLARELYYCATRSRNIVDVELLTQGLHDLESGEMCRRVQQAVDATDPDLYFAVAMGFALCNNGLIGLKATSVPLVVPRAHDCITLFLGSKERYGEIFFSHPGTFFVTTGWTERDRTNKEDTGHDSVMRKLGLDLTYDQYVAKYGEDNAKFILEQLGDGLQNYSCYAYIDMGLPTRRDYVTEARKDALEREWSFLEFQGDLSLLQRLVDADWGEEDFLVLQSGQSVARASDSRILTAGDGT